MICSRARVDQQKFRAGFLNSDERRQLQVALLELSEAPLFIDDSSSTNLMDVHAKLRRLQSEHGLGLVIIDYLQLMGSRGRSESTDAGVSVPIEPRDSTALRAIGAMIRRRSSSV